MYNHNIDIFLAVAEYGSITKAADRLFMSTTSVMNKINALEKILGVSLFKRSGGGSVLTRQGEYFYGEIHGFIAHSESIIVNTRRADRDQNHIIRIGCSALNPTKRFNRIWKSSPQADKFIVSIVSYPSDINATVPGNTSSANTADIGFAAEPSVLNFVDTGFLPFDKYALTVAAPLDHPLASRKSLTVSDLEGETLYFPSRGNPSLTDSFANSIRASCPGIKVETPPLFYDLEIFNRCAEEHRLLVSLDCWDQLHPGLANIPVDWEWSMPYGLIWKKDARKEVLDFIEAFKEGLEHFKKSDR